MSGLAALFHRDGRPVEGAAVGRMLAAAPYRGPDGTCVRVGATVGLGHARMIVTPEEEDEQQPLLSPRTGCILTADVRLDNREELLARLPERLSPMTTDAEIILRAYETWGADALPQLLGDFAFVLWDPRGQRLVCARDTSGQRTLYYRLDHRTFAAASEIQQLLQDPTVPVTPNEERIRDFLVPLNMFQNEKDQAATFFAGISALPAGHVLTVEQGAERIQRYWDLGAPAELRYRGDDEYAEHYLSLFSDVVRARLRASRPIGVLLSGGLDSSSVACVAQELYGRGVAQNAGFVGFHLDFDGLECGERGFVHEIEAKYGFPTRYIPPPESVNWLQLEPTGFYESPNTVISIIRDTIFEQASQAGVRALLTGEIADGCVGGLPLVFDSLLRRGRLRTLWRHLAAYRRTSSERLRKILALHCLAPMLPLEVQRRVTTAYVDRWGEWDRRSLLPAWMPPELREDLYRRDRRLRVEAERARRFSNPARETEYRLLYPPEVSRRPTGWPLQLWQPFADRRLHEFLLAIPPEVKFAPHPETDEFYAASKQLVRQAMRGIVPESIRTRTTKTVFAAVFENEVAHHWARFESTFGPTGRSQVAQRGYVHPGLFWSRLEELRAGARGQDFGYLIRVVGLETWLRGIASPRPQVVTVSSPWREGSPSMKLPAEALVPVGPSP
jgi:asparagine synthase (glutamine-hydrolysing)